MEEIFEIVKAINAMGDKLSDLSKKTETIYRTLPYVPQEYFSEQDACEYLRMSKRSLARLRSKHKVKYIYSNRKIRYRPADLDEYLTTYCLRH